MKIITATILALSLTACDIEWGSKTIEQKAYEACQSAVKIDLRSPSTAVFQDVDRVNFHIGTDEDNPLGWHLIGSGEAMNGFGAMTRFHFSCHLERFSNTSDHFIVKSRMVF